MTEAETAALERLARIETDLANLRQESQAIRTTLHNLIGTALADHSAAIRALMAAHERHTGVWWAIGWVSAALLVVIGGLAWLVEHDVKILIKP